jgi:hypothetical protein
MVWTMVLITVDAVGWHVSLVGYGINAAASAKGNLQVIRSAQV